VSLARFLSILGQTSIDPDDLGQLIEASTDKSLWREVNRQLDVLAIAISNFISVFNPEIVVLAGFLPWGLLEADPTRLNERVASNSFRQLSTDVHLVRAQLRSQHLLVGAAESAFASILRDPSSMERTRS
jgi:predicted NBD/HSP70 family sugar kinase